MKETIQIRATKENMRISWRCDHTNIRATILKVVQRSRYIINIINYQCHTRFVGHMIKSEALYEGLHNEYCFIGTVLGVA